MKLYRFDVLTEQKALSTGKTGTEIRTALLKKLKMSRTRFYRLRQSTTDDYVNMPLRDMVRSADFFGCSVDELINSPAARKLK